SRKYERTMSGESGVLPDKGDCVYTKCYCEENIWKACDYVRTSKPESLDRLFVVFISNKSRSVPIWEQTSSKSVDGFVLWDYHVVLLCKGQDGGKNLIYDLDSKLPFPCDMTKYCELSFCPHISLKEEYKQCFKVVAGLQFLDKFASDRSHMKTEDGIWMSPPPDYPCISTNSCRMNLDDFISMDVDCNTCGTIFSLAQFMNEYANI
uniref:Protein N-terminal glutamine amidohydrolase n=1 Tax=Ciona savignyi TaxID=51511 RepID=H2YYH5_CIOSA